MTNSKSIWHRCNWQFKEGISHIMNVVCHLLVVFCEACVPCGPGGCSVWESRPDLVAVCVRADLTWWQCVWEQTWPDGSVCESWPDLMAESLWSSMATFSRTGSCSRGLCSSSDAVRKKSSVLQASRKWVCIPERSKRELLNYSHLWMHLFTCFVAEK